MEAVFDQKQEAVITQPSIENCWNMCKSTLVFLRCRSTSSPSTCNNGIIGYDYAILNRQIPAYNNIVPDSHPITYAGSRSDNGVVTDGCFITHNYIGLYCHVRADITAAADIAHFVYSCVIANNRVGVDYGRRADNDAFPKC